jgi:hypothetical protein
MPKKKLTKAQIKKKYQQMMLITASLAKDKMEIIDSLVPQSSKVLIEFNNKFAQVARKLK